MCAQNASVSVISVFSWGGGVSYLGKLIAQHETVALMATLTLFPSSSVWCCSLIYLFDWIFIFNTCIWSGESDNEMESHVVTAVTAQLIT